jgi:8-oxo-dGTP diphosphatase
MRALPMPPADRPVVTALRLPPHYPITPEPGGSDEDFLRAIGALLDAGENLIQLRCKDASASRRRALAYATHARAREAGAQILINGDAALADELDVGLHLPSPMLMQMTQRLLASDRWVAASCHDARELAHAAAIGVDFAVLGPVKPTASHPQAATSGWERFAELVARAPLPVYALGGLTPSDLPAAKNAGAQGIAGISGFWSGGG